MTTATEGAVRDSGRPSGSDRPSESRISTSVDGQGYPMVPVKVSMSARLKVTPGEVSERPYPSTIGCPVMRFHFSATADFVAIPPPTQRTSREKLTFAKRG